MHSLLSPKPLQLYHALHSTTIPTPSPPPSFVTFAGRKKTNNKNTNNSNSSPYGRIEGSSEVRRKAKAKARIRSRRLTENLFYRRSQQAKSTNYPDSFAEWELNNIGLGYDRAVRFMAPDDPDLRHPYDWYKYGQYGPYSWRGIVVGPPIRGMFTDERVSIFGEVKDHEEWEKIEQFDMSVDYCRKLDSDVGLRYFWVFVRHPNWKVSELPWEQWTLVAEVAVEAGKQRLDKWNIVARLGNRTRSMVSQCAAWMRPDIIYVKKPVYQCRFEPQDEFFKVLRPMLDPETEMGYPCELKCEDGSVEVGTYYGGLCKILRISQKTPYVDDVVKAYLKLTDEGKSRCLEFLLSNHPMELLHPYTREWKAKLEEMELGCDAPDDSDDDSATKDELQEVTDWIEDDEESGSDYDDGGDDDVEEDDDIIDIGEEVGEDEDKEENKIKEDNPEATEEYWNEQWKKALRSSEEMEKVVKKSMEISSMRYEKQIMEMELREKAAQARYSSTIDMASQQIKEDRKAAGYSDQKRSVKSKIPPQLFLKSSVRLFTYTNLVKEIVLMRHGILDGDIPASE